MQHCRGCNAAIDAGAATHGFCDRCAEEVASFRRRAPSYSLGSSLWSRLTGVEEPQTALLMYRSYDPYLGPRL
jgi:hypothetical protein